MTKILGGLALVMMLAASCGGDSSNGTTEQAVRRYGQVLCEGLRTCDPGAFAQTFPSGVPACVEKLVSMLPPSELNKTSACSDEEVQACVRDTSTLSCEAKNKATIPTSCSKC